MATGGKKFKVLVSDKLSDAGLEIFKSCPEIELTVKTGMGEAELIGMIGEFNGLVVRSATKVTKKVIDAAVNMQVIGRAGIGVDNVDVDAASSRGIIVMNTPGGNIVTTAEHAISMMLTLCRQIPVAYAKIRKGDWDKKSFMGVEIYKKTLGLVGLGRIGSLVAERAIGLKMNVIAADPFISADVAKKLGVELVSLDELFKRSDFISIHTVLTKETKNLIDASAFAKMKKGVRIINCARGGIVNEKDLVEAVKSKKVAGAALDVLEQEPPNFADEVVNMDEIIVTPHLGATTSEAQENVALDIANQMVVFFSKGEIQNAVNVPSVSAEHLPKLAPFLDLAEKLGSLQAQLAQGGAKKISLSFSGEVAGYDTKPLVHSFLKGYLSRFSEEGVNYVSAPYLAQARGIEVERTKTTTAHDFASLIATSVSTDSGTREIFGTVFGAKEPRIVKLENCFIEAVPAGNMLVFNNVDKPGVIGNIGTALGKHGVNIAGFQLGRSAPGAEAVSIVNIDAEPADSVLAELAKIPNVIRVTKVML